MKPGRRCCWVVVTWWWWWWLYSTCLSNGQPCPATPTSAVSLPRRWNNSYSAPRFYFQDNTSVLPILHTGNYGCGFYGNETVGEYFFTVFILDSNCYCHDVIASSVCHPQVVWSANSKLPVKIGSTMEFQSDGYWIMEDAWILYHSSGETFASLNLTKLGNLMLVDDRNMTVWQSFDNPTDSLVPGQTLKVGQRLSTATNLYLTDQSYINILLSISMTREQGLVAQVDTVPPQVYYRTVSDSSVVHQTNSSYIWGSVQFLNGRLTFYSGNGTEILNRPMPTTNYTQYIRFGIDGHLRLYQLRENRQWNELDDLLMTGADACAYPTVCGEYGICSSSMPRQCPCPEQNDGGTTYFRPVKEQLGCSAITPLSCEESNHQSFVELTDVAYRPSVSESSIRGISRKRCKYFCANNCECKAAFFYDPMSIGQDTECSLVNQVFSLAGETPNWDAYIKVQNVPASNHHGKNNRLSLKVIIGTSISSLVLLMAILLIIFIWRKGVVLDNDAERYLSQFPGMPTRFSYDDLKAMTGDFRKKLGEGGFGSVFEGNLTDGRKIAVKCLGGIGPIKIDSFFSEVKSIGGIHHVNLVRLLGFCVEKSHRLLVYEYMDNGSLEGWIFDKMFTIRWQKRKNIILDIARGLHYLHSECRKKIIHLDIKPQNILLDDKFNAKVSDFGLSKLINKDQSRIVMTMRGTPGYLAPEWLSSVITEKVDVYSFGVVILEVVCGRKVFDASKDEEDRYLLNLLKRKAEEDRLLDMVSTGPAGSVKDAEFCVAAEAVKMVKLAAWCLQGDHTKRPSMLMVIKVLEGVIDVKQDLDYNFWNHRAQVDKEKDDVLEATAPPLPYILSGPR